MPIPDKPYTRREAYLNAAATGDSSGIPETPYTREEMYLDAIARGGGGGGGGGGGSSTLSGLTDVDISNPTDGQMLVYNAESGKWENGSGGGGAAYFVDCSYALDKYGNPKLTSSKTTAEIRAAMESGALVYIRFVEPGDTSEGVPDMTRVYSLSGMSVGTAEGVTMASFGIVILYSGRSDQMYTDYTAMADYPVFASPR